MTFTLLIVKEINLNNYRATYPDHCHIVIYDNYDLNFWSNIILKVLLPIAKIRKIEKDNNYGIVEFSCNNIKLFNDMINNLSIDKSIINHAINFKKLNKTELLEIGKIYFGQFGKVLFQFESSPLFKN